MRAQWVQQRLASLNFLPSEDSTQPDPRPSDFAGKVCDHLRGIPHSFDEVAVLEQNLTEFAQTVYRAAREIPSGRTTTYGEIAKAIGKPGASRAVGTALGNNPFLLVVPCHRVLARNGGLGGFSAPGGVQTKELMLAAEGYGVESLWQPGELERARQHLVRCAKLGPVIERVGPCDLTPLYPDDPFAALARAVLYQQLATSAARAIETRLFRTPRSWIPWTPKPFEKRAFRVLKSRP